MKQRQQIFQALMALVMVVGLLAPAAMAVQPDGESRLQPALVEAVAAASDQLVRVIVQKADDTGQAEALVVSLGGRYLKDLSFISGFAAELPAQAVDELGQSASVRWVSLDAPVISTARPGGDGGVTENVYLDTLGCGTSGTWATPAKASPWPSSTAGSKTWKKT